MKVLSGLAAVDHLVIFEDDTPFDVIAAIRPDVLVKGGDYEADTVVGAEIVRESGGKVVIVPLLAGRSTTALLASFKE